MEMRRFYAAARNPEIDVPKMRQQPTLTPMLNMPSQPAQSK
jgi:hypothetical protein